MTNHITIPRALLEQALESLWQMTKKFNFERPHESRLSDSNVRVSAHDAMNAIRAELAKPVERVEPITLDQFRAIANRTATTYRHRSDPEKSSYAFVDGSSLDDFWRKVCEAIQPTPAWNDAPEVAALKAERDAQLAVYDGVVDNLQSQVDELVAALKGVIRVADRKTDEFDAARAAIAKAEGESA